MCPFGSLFSMLCQTAHLGAAAEDQTRAWVPSLPVVLLLPPRGCARRFDQTTTSLMMNQRWGESPVIQTAVGRQTPPAPLPARYVAISFTKTASYLRLNHQRAATFSRLAGSLTEGYFSSNKRFYGTSTGLSRFTPLLSSLQRQGRRQSS